MRLFAATPDFLCRVDGAVPLVMAAVDLSGRAIKNYEDWQQGVLFCAPAKTTRALPGECLVAVVDRFALMRGDRLASVRIALALHSER